MRNTKLVSKRLHAFAAATAAFAFLVAQPVAAKGASKQEKIGVGSGALVGAVVAGPVGFIVGSAFGAKIGDSFHKKSERIDGLQGELQGSNQTIVGLEQDIDELDNEVQELRGLARPQLVALLQAGINMDMLFRTDEYALTDATGDRLAQLAATLVGMPDVRIQLDGYADERGDADYNQALSEKRVEFVRGLILEAGVSPARISVTAHGESPAQDARLDSYALERRVSVTLFIDASPSMALLPN